MRRRVNEHQRHRRAALHWVRGAWGAATVLLPVLLAACGPPPMEPLTEAMLAAAEDRWEAHGADAYHLVVRVRVPSPPWAHVDPAVYDVVVTGGEVTRIARDGQPLPPGDADRHDYSVSGLFDLLREDVPLTNGDSSRSDRPVDLRARFEAETGRLELYRRTVGTDRRRVLLIEVLEYEPLAGRERSAVAP
ncbi:MAG: hypothetical protein HY657_15065 [Acidobacteria bacterium]|nr:hypothetical protein [Acidobacteriota bacterium]